jgi:hypothetical protein
MPAERAGQDPYSIAPFRPAPGKLDDSAALAITNILDHHLGHLDRPQTVHPPEYRPALCANVRTTASLKADQDAEMARLVVDQLVEKFAPSARSRGLDHQGHRQPDFGGGV